MPHPQVRQSNHYYCQSKRSFRRCAQRLRFRLFSPNTLGTFGVALRQGLTTHTTWQIRICSSTQSKIYVENSCSLVSLTQGLTRRREACAKTP